MIDYGRINIFEGIDVKKCNGMSRQCSLCKFYYFINKNFNCQRYLCDWCQDISIKAIGIQNINAYRVIICLRLKMMLLI